jgi:drug/metabolite transporter (DMT)-like permease
VISGSAGLGATALGLLAAAFWGGGDFTGGMATRRASPFVTVALAHGLSLIVLVAAAFSLHLPNPSPQARLLAVLSGVLGALSLVLFYEALASGQMGISAAIAGLLSALIPVGVSFFTEGLPHLVQIAGFLLAAVAIWLIAATPGGASNPRALGMATIAGIGFGIYFVLLKIDGKSGVVWPMAYVRLGSCSFATVAAIFQAWIGPKRPENAPDAHRKYGSVFAPAFLALAAATSVLDTGGNMLYTMATRVGRLDVASVLASLYPAGTILLAAWLLKERTTRTQALGMALALAAVILIAF